MKKECTEKRQIKLKRKEKRKEYKNYLMNSKNLKMKTKEKKKREHEYASKQFQFTRRPGFNASGGRWDGYVAWSAPTFSAS